MTNWFRMFYGLSNIKNIIFNIFDLSWTNTAPKFRGCSNLISLDLSNFDTSSFENMNNIFYGCSSLNNLKKNFI